MLAIERRSEILALLETQKSVLVADLGKKYGVTEETIRRDLERLEKEGLVKKTYGGAVLAENIAAEPPYKMRVNANREQKLIIAKKVFGLVDSGDNLMLDASSTGMLIAKRLKEKKKITIITNSVEILLTYADSKNATVISTGGKLRESSLSLVGRDAERMLGNFTVDKAIISCKGLELHKGLMESNVAETEVKKAMADSAKQLILAVDSSKFGKPAFARLFDISRVDIVVTDAPPPPAWQTYFAENNIKVW